MASAIEHGGLETPSAWVLRFLPLIPAGLTLDLACGSGRHARLLATAGHPVLAVDRNAEALERVAAHGDPRIRTAQVDLEAGEAAEQQSGWPFKSSTCSGIIVTNYLHRPLFPALFDSLAAGGVLIYETFASGNGRYGKPSSPAFLLEPGELLALTASAGPAFRVIAFEDGHVRTPRPAMVQRICVVRGQPADDAGLSL